MTARYHLVTGPFLQTLNSKKAWKRRVNERSVKKDLHVKGYSSFSRRSNISWKGGSYMYMYIYIYIYIYIKLSNNGK